MTDKNILIEYSGWCTITSDKVKFHRINKINDEADIITGEEWLKLDDSIRPSYILGNTIDAIRDADDGEWLMLEFSRGGDVWALGLRDLPKHISRPSRGPLE